MAAYFLTDMLYDNGKKEAENEVLETPVLPEKQAEVENTLIDTAIIEPKPSIVKSPVDSASFSKERVAVVKTKKKEVPSQPSTPSVPAWQNEIGKKARTCPFSLRLGVQVTSIAYNTSSVTCTLVYEEMSKYNITEYAREQMRSDEEKIKKSICQDFRLMFV